MLALVNLSEPVMDTFLILTGFLAAHSLGSAFQHGKAPRQVPFYIPSLALAYLALRGLAEASR
jgi:hypothetical protein